MSLYCSFCGASEQEVETLVAGQARVAICNICIGTAAEACGGAVVPGGARGLAEADLNVGAALTLLDDAGTAIGSARKTLADWREARERAVLLAADDAPPAPRDGDRDDALAACLEAVIDRVLFPVRLYGGGQSDDVTVSALLPAELAERAAALLLEAGRW